MLRTTLSALIAASALLPADPLAAQETATAAPTLSIVSGLSNGDLLNIRATASAVGAVMDRLPNGASVTNHGCGDVNGYEWCKVAEVGRPELSGWAPARYLQSVEAEAAADTDAADPAQARKAEAPGAAPTIEPPQKAAAAGPQPREAGGAAKPALPADLMARFGGDTSQAATQPKSAAAIGRTAVEDAYGLAFAAREKQALADNPAPGNEDAPAWDDATAAAAVPVPTPRPGMTNAAPGETDPGHKMPGEAVAAIGEPVVDAGTVGQVRAQPAAAARDAAGEIPCARYVGQPMTRCEASVARKGDGAADVTVTWPDGGTRVIGFFAGKPAGANSRGAFRFTREGDLNMIRLGVSERFEIPDALAFGD